MPRYQRKITEVHAVKNDGNPDIIKTFLVEVGQQTKYWLTADGTAYVTSPDGYTISVPVGWYLMWDPKGFSPSRPEFFTAIYEGPISG